MPLRVCFVVHELYSHTNLMPWFPPQWSQTLWRWRLLLRLSRKWRGTRYSWAVRSHARRPSTLTFLWAGTCDPLMTPILVHVTWSPCHGTLFYGRVDSTRQRLSSGDLRLDKTSATSYRLTIYKLQPTDQGEFYCEASEWIQDADHSWYAMTRKESEKTSVKVQPTGEWELFGGSSQHL